jgi:hypothetical protein
MSADPNSTAYFGRSYLLMEFLEGRPLNAFLKAAAPSPCARSPRSC